MFRLKYFILTVSIFFLSIASSLPTTLDDDTDFLSTSPSHLDAVEQSQDWNNGIKPAGWIIASKATDVQPSTNPAGFNSIATQFTDDQEQAPEQFISVKPSSDTSGCLGAGGKGVLAPVRELLAPIRDLFRGPDRCKVPDDPRVAPDKGNDGPNCPNGKDLFCCDNPGFTQDDTQNGGHMRGECDICKTPFCSKLATKLQVTLPRCKGFPRN